MPPQTEAACLLESGAAYRRRLGLRDPSGALTFAGFKPGGFSLYCDDAPYFHFDLEGRWQRALVDGVHYLKGLDAATEAIERVREGSNLVLHRRRLPFAEAGQLDERIRALALDLADGLATGRLEPVAPAAPAVAIDPGDLRAMLDRIGGWDAAAWFRQREAYVAAYGPLPFLPPSCPSPIVLQATVGHATGWGFGGGETAEPWTRSVAEFESHARAVAALLGRRAAQARGLVLAGGDLLRRPADEVAPYFEVAAALFPIAGPDRRPRLSERPDDEPLLDGLYAFLDDLAPPRPDRDGFARLRDWHLRRVDLGVESGDPEVRALYGKTWADADLRETVADLKAAGIAASVVLLVGAGGAENADRHALASSRLIESLPLDRGDLVYLLDALEGGGEAGRDLLRHHGLTPLVGEAVARAAGDLRERLAAVAKGRGFKVVPYSLQKQ